MRKVSHNVKASESAQGVQGLVVKRLVLLLAAATWPGVAGLPAQASTETASHPATGQVVSAGQDSPRLAAARDLIGLALILRAGVAGGTLAFDASGHLLAGEPAKQDWTLAGVEVESVSEVNGQQGPAIEMTGFQVATGYNAETHLFERHVLKSRPLTIRLAEPATPDEVSAALGHMFAVGIDPPLQMAMPAYWLHYFRPNTDWGKGDLTIPAGAAVAGAGGKPLDPRITRPTVISQKAPGYTEEARLNHVQGRLLLSLVVDATGKPVHIQVVRPLGFGLEQKAVEAVAGWRFEPATLDAVAIPVEIRLEINMTYVPEPAK